MFCIGATKLEAEAGLLAPDEGTVGLLPLHVQQMVGTNH